MRLHSVRSIRRSGMLLCLGLLFTAPCFGQWATSGNNIYNSNSGNVGIGKINPVNAKLEIVQAAAGEGLRIDGASGGFAFVVKGGTDRTAHARSGLTVGTNYFTTPPSNGVIVEGNVGIGTTTPDHKLDVNGTARAKEVVVESGWSDFVFEDDYDLRSLAEVERYIETHGRLPEIPSAEEIEAHGVAVGEMQAKLLQKIEELTLYIIDLEKRLASVETQDN